MSSLDEAWARALPRLSVISGNVFRKIPPKIFRVSQLDAELLDQELAQLLQEPLFRALSTIRASLKSRYDHELSLLVQLVLYKLSIWDTGASYGSKLQDLRYIVTSPSRSTLTPSGIPRRTLLLHGLLTILVPYLYARIRTHALSRAWPDAPSSDTRRKAWSLLTSLESAHGLLALTNFVAFLWNGRYRTLSDRVLRMRLMPFHRQTKRDVSYEFMNRQMVWHAFTEFLLFLLPLINVRGISRRFYRLLSSTSSGIKSFITSTGCIKHSSSNTHEAADLVDKRGKYWTLPHDQCAICAENASFNLNSVDTLSSTLTSRQRPTTPTDEPDPEPCAYPITVPYIASCGDMYCYYCIAERMIQAAEDDDSQWECLRCGKLITSVERFAVNVEDNGSSDYDFTDEELGSTDLSGSLGSYLYSESENELHA